MHELWAGVLPRQVFADAPPRGFDDRRTPVRRPPARPDRAARRRAGRGDRGAGGAGRGRDALPHPGLPAGAARGCATRTACCWSSTRSRPGSGARARCSRPTTRAVTPDVMCVGKALTGGYLTMAATLCTARVADGISRGEVPVLAHGPTFMGNPLAAAVACASIDLLLGQDWRGGGQARSRRACGRGSPGPRGCPGVRDVRVLGRDRRGPARPRGRHGGGHGGGGRARACGCGPFRDLVYTMPPYVTGDEDVARIADAVVAAARASCGVPA